MGSSPPKNRGEHPNICELPPPIVLQLDTPNLWGSLPSSTTTGGSPPQRNPVLSLGDLLSATPDNSVALAPGSGTWHSSLMSFVQVIYVVITILIYSNPETIYIYIHMDRCWCALYINILYIYLYIWDLQDRRSCFHRCHFKQKNDSWRCCECNNHCSWDDVLGNSSSRASCHGSIVTIQIKLVSCPHSNVGKASA